jgi:transcriptional regulator with XRE-family HTH domain
MYPSKGTCQPGGTVTGKGYRRANYGSRLYLERVRMKVAEYLDQARAASELPSDYAISVLCGVSRQAVSDWRYGRKYPGGLALFRLALLAKVDPARLTADLESEKAERAGQVDQAGAWRDMLRKLGGVAASVAGAVILSAAPTPSNASSGAASQPAGPASTSYTSCTIRRRRRAAWWAPLVPSFKLG